MILVFLGPPGSGKGTQAKRFSTSKGWPQISTGDMLRASIAKGTKLGLEAKAYMDKGALVPDQVVIGMIQDRSEQPDSEQGFILDGFPRTIPQGEALDKMLKAQNRTIDRAILFKIDDGELVRRLSGRRICTNCNSMFHLENAKPKKEGICDSCASKLIQRDDDRPEVIQKRLSVYHQQTSPLVEYYRKQSKLRIINASLPPDEVYSELSQTFN